MNRRKNIRIGYRARDKPFLDKNNNYNNETYKLSDKLMILTPDFSYGSVNLSGPAARRVGRKVANNRMPSLTSGYFMLFDTVLYLT